jgi:hypothetical protein
MIGDAGSIVVGDDGEFPVVCDSTPDTVDVPFHPRRELAQNYACARQCIQQQYALLLESSVRQQPPLLKNVEPGPVYDMGPERGGPVRASIRITSEPPGGFDITVPLGMVPYKIPKDPKMCFNVTACQNVDSENEVLENHNRYLTSLLSLFVHHNGCGTSAGHVTLPPPPDNMVITRTRRLDALFKDKYSSTMLAVRYLHDQGKVCEEDYRIEDAITFANDCAFEVYVGEKRAKGRFRYRMPGSPPAHWDGDVSHKDSAGRRVVWVRGKYHSFISVDVHVALADDELALVMH